MKKIILFLVVFIIPFKVFAISAKSSIVMDLDNGIILDGYNYNEQHLIASITKIMTCLIAVEYGNLDEQITVGEEVLKAYGSAIYIEMGEKLTLRDLLYGLMLRSGNDAALVIAKIVGNTQEGFVMMMNEEAKKIGMNNTYFYNPHGLENSDGKGNISTAYDMALLTKYAMNNEVFKKIFGTKEYNVKTNYKTYHWISKNKLIHNYDFITGGKTGYTKKAHRTLVTTASKNNLNIVVVTLDDSNDFNDHITLHNNIFNNYKSIKILDKDNIKIKDDKIYNKYKLFINNNIYVPIKNNNDKIIINYNLYKDIKIYNGDIIGYADIYLNNNLIRKEYIYIKVPPNIPKKNWFQKIIGWFK